ncbi:zinc finger protein 622 [Contarinia nasturtii]|uniref:zinc finger protein 622 n=1 Tax=Contarinia nasturtii TaxID=265458 RepID=UPI0012D42459|nr:zinc finger protein 622 [Contarinia nasturtii]
MSAPTCLNCNVRFQNADIQREHYKTDWHRYNLKRRVADLPPITAEDFQKRVLQQRASDELAQQEVTLYCGVCRKQFISEKSHQNHLNSKKHKENVQIAEKKGQNLGGQADIPMIQAQKKEENTVANKVEEDDDDDEDDMEVEEVDSDEWDDDFENPIANNDCIFCGEHSEDMVENVKHMSSVHSFFIPDTEFITDLDGLLMYLGEKVARDFICLWCNDRGRTFYSLDAVRKHMKDKGHCRMLHEGLALAEYADFYDYSSSYPDHEDGMDVDTEVAAEVLEGDEYQLVLPSGAVIGHRSLLKYYKQRLNPNRALVPKNKKLHKVLSEYRALGWTTTQQAAAAKKARDIHHMKRQYQKWSQKLGVKANKLQRHFRPQVDKC